MRLESSPPATSAVRVHEYSCLSSLAFPRLARGLFRLDPLLLANRALTRCNFGFPQRPRVPITRFSVSRSRQALRFAPSRNLRMVSAQQHIRYGETTEFGRARIAWRADAAIKERV